MSPVKGKYVFVRRTKMADSEQWAPLHIIHNLEEFLWKNAFQVFWGNKVSGKGQNWGPIKW